MIQIEIVVRNEAGQQINERTQSLYTLDVKDYHLDEIETKVVEVQRQVSKGLVHDILKEGQRDYLEQRPVHWRLNGTETIRLATLQGIVDFESQRFCDETRKNVGHYLQLSQPIMTDFVSGKLMEWLAYYSNRLSYKEVERLLKNTSGETILTDQQIWRKVVEKAQGLVSKQETQVAQWVLEHGDWIPKVETSVDIYDPQEPEILMMEDAILVKSQKEERQSGKRAEEEEEQDSERISTSVVILQTPDTTWEYITEGMFVGQQTSPSLAEKVRYRLHTYYAQQSHPMKVVFISDGASDIRRRIMDIFGVMAVLILDWYHLAKRLREFLSMIALNKEEKRLHLKSLLKLLWRGNVREALEYLVQRVQSRNEKKYQELQGYLRKHEQEIIDYGRRKTSGKVIGSGQMEKAVDQVVGHRQKKKGSSWRLLGSRALANLKVIELNRQWKEVFPLAALA